MVQRREDEHHESVAVTEFQDLGLRQMGMGLDLDHGGIDFSPS
jgi:hypothetical protein